MSGSRYRWVILILSYLCMLGLAFSIQSLPPILTLIIKDLDLTHAKAGLLVSLFALPTIFLAVLFGSFSDRWGSFKMGVISLILIIVGALIFALSHTFLYAGLGRVITGIGATAVFIVSAQMVSQWFRGREIGTAMGIFNTVMPVGAIVCFTTFGRLAESLGWRVPIFITMIIGAAGLTSFLILYKPVSKRPQGIASEKERQPGLFSSLLKVGTLMWSVGFCWMFFSASLVSFITFAPDFFISKGYTIGFAGFLTSLLSWGPLGLSPLIGRLMDKVGNNEVFIAVGGIIMAMAFYSVARGGNFLLPMVVMGLGVALVPAPVFSLLPKISRPENLGLSFGILSMFASMGMLFGPYVTGLLKDRTGSYEVSFIFLSIFALLLTLTALVLRSKRRGD